MKNIVLRGTLVFVMGLFVPQFARSQGTVTYLSSIGPSVTSEAVGSDSWVAATFRAGDNAGGYVLDSLQLEMAAASGTPNGFTVQLYGLPADGLPNPGNSLATLSGPTDPTSADVYTFDASGITLAPDAQYFIVLTAATPVSTGLYAWGVENPSSNISSGNDWTEGGVMFESSDGSSWNETYINDPQFALTASAVPEPDALGLLGLSGLLLFVWRYRRAKAQTSIVG
jgi:hypothetical protein